MTNDDEVRTSHPSYGIAKFSRAAGNAGRLFGSPLSDHHHFIVLRIEEGEHVHARDLGRDAYSSSTRVHIEAILSETQFVELITSANVGSGVPCTITRLNGANVETPPEVQAESERLQADFRHAVGHELMEKIKRGREFIRGMFDSKRTIGQQDRKDILKIFDRLISDVSADLPFLLRMLHESVGRVVHHAKVEVATAALANGARVPELPEYFETFESMEKEVLSDRDARTAAQENKLRREFAGDLEKVCKDKGIDIGSLSALAGVSEKHARMLLHLEQGGDLPMRAIVRVADALGLGLEIRISR